MATKPFRPMLAEDATIEYCDQLIRRYGHLLASYKLDGIRCGIHGSAPMSRSMKLIPNAHVQMTFAYSQGALNGLDGELIIGPPCGDGVFARCSSGVMSHGGKPDFRFYVFDDFTMPDMAFEKRSEDVERQVINWQAEPDPMYEFLRFVLQYRVTSAEELIKVEEEAVAQGYEGLIVRRPDAPYKQGRSTLKEAFMLKLKRFKDGEARIVDFQELYHNANEAKADERGFTKRSSRQAGKIAAGTLGALVVKDASEPTWVFNIGTGFDQALRQRIWDNQAYYRGKLVKYKYLPVGTLELPRHPVFLGFRDPIDL